MTSPCAVRYGLGTHYNPLNARVTTRVHPFIAVAARLRSCGTSSRALHHGLGTREAITGGSMRYAQQRKRLRAILNGDQCVSPASVHDPLSARVAETVGYELGM